MGNYILKRICRQDIIILGIAFFFCAAIFLQIRSENNERTTVDTAVLMEDVSSDWEETLSDNPEGSQIVYYTPHGSKYHLSSDCRYLAHSKAILEATLLELTDLGYAPCSGCAKQ